MKRRIICSEVLATYYNLYRKINRSHLFEMNPGGTHDFGFVKITMVKARSGSSCAGPPELVGGLVEGGIGCGFIIDIPGINEIIYYAGDTEIFSDMQIINDLYKPTIGFLPIGGKLGMGSKEACHALTHYLTNLKFVIPMFYNIVPGYPQI